MLTLTDVTWLYQHLPMRFSLTIAAGEQIAILGPSGAGKSTLLSLVAGFLAPASGSIVINGVDHTRTPPSARPVSMLFQENNLFSHLTAGQNIALGMHPGMKLDAAQKQRLREITERVGLADMLDRLPTQLSGGQRQRVAIARAIALRPPLLILDEAVSALDVSVRRQILELLVEIQRETAVACVFVSHDLAVIRAVCHRVAIMEAGRIVEIGRTANIVSTPQSSTARTLIEAAPRLTITTQG